MTESSSEVYAKPAALTNALPGTSGSTCQIACFRLFWFYQVHEQLNACFSFILCLQRTKETLNVLAQGDFKWRMHFGVFVENFVKSFVTPLYMLPPPCVQGYGITANCYPRILGKLFWGNKISWWPWSVTVTPHLLKKSSRSVFLFEMVDSDPESTAGVD